ncbi:MAG TPA: heparinase II/III family protein, partial [Rhizobiaceae bacterium]|nr:heparinase II/III family protein [Rhizobiaceae bacterium]
MTDILYARSEVWAALLREIWRRMRKRIRTGIIWRRRVGGRIADRITLSPPDLHFGDAQVARDIYEGRFAFVGFGVETGGESPFAVAPPSLAWEEELHGFCWLRHLGAASSDLASANARALANDWIELWERRNAEPAWAPGVTAQRVQSWLRHAPLVLAGADHVFYRRFMRALSRQVHFLRREARDMPPGVDRLKVRIVLAIAALALPRLGIARTASRRLAEELDAQILPDGGHVSRNPLLIAELLAELLPLRQCHAEAGVPPSQALVGAIDRMFPALRFFRHSDGAIAHFNGAGPTPTGLVATVLRQDESAGQPLAAATHSGFQRLAAGGTVLIADTGAPPRADQSSLAHAGCLSFEFSSLRQRIVVNCGAPAIADEDLRQLARTTAAHSTAIVGETSSARLRFPPSLSELLRTPLLRGPRKVGVRRLAARDESGFVAEHDGYAAAFNILHRRTILLHETGDVIDGEDRFAAANGRNVNVKRDGVIVRFHLHPSIGAEILPAGLIALTAQNGDRWIFAADPVAGEI